MNIELRPLKDSEEDTFIRENQIAFDKAAIEEFGPQDESVIDRKTIEECLHGKFSEAFRIIADGKAVGGVVVGIHPDTRRNELYLLFVSPECHSRGIGQAVWQLIEERYPETKVWETHTPLLRKAQHPLLREQVRLPYRGVLQSAPSRTARRALRHSGR